MVKMISKTSMEAFEKEVNEFITKDDVIVDNIQYSTELDNARAVSNGFANVTNTTLVTRHYAMITYRKDDKSE